MKTRVTFAAALLALGALYHSGLCRSPGHAHCSGPRTLPAEYTKDGDLVLPKNWRSWVYVRSPLTPDGGDTQQRSLRVLKPGGILVSVVSPVPEATQTRYGVRAAYFYVDVTTARLNTLTELFESSRLVTEVGTVLSLEDARAAHEMLGGALHKRGKIVLRLSGADT